MTFLYGMNIFHSIKMSWHENVMACLNIAWKNIVHVIVHELTFKSKITFLETAIFFMLQNGHFQVMVTDGKPFHGIIFSNHIINIPKSVITACWHAI